MTRILLAGAAALGMMATGAIAETSTSETTTTMAAPAAPVTVTRTVGNKVTGEGVNTLSNGAAARDASGNLIGTTNANTAYPFSNIVTSQQKKIEMVNGVPTETVVTTNAYPPGATAAPVTTTKVQTAK